MNERERRSSEILQQVRPILQEGNPLDVEDGAEAEQDFNMYVLWTHGFLLGGASDDEFLNHLSVMGRMDRKPREKQALVAVVERLRAIDVTLPPDDTPTIERETIQAAFRFLSAYQFAEAAPDPAYAWIRVTFSAPRLRVDASYNWRDGF